MTTPCADCVENIDPRKLVREGTNQIQRIAGAPDPAKVPVDERRSEHAMVFAAGYAAHLRYFDAANTHSGDWSQFFTDDVSVRLAAAAVDDIAVYRSTVKSYLRAIEDPVPPPDGAAMITALSAIFDLVGSLARRLDSLAGGLPSANPLRATLTNLIRTQLSPMLRRLIGYYEAGKAINVVIDGTPPDGVRILGRPVESFSTALATPLGADWPIGVGLDTWTAYKTVVETEYRGAYGQIATDVARVNHLGTHNMFTAICETFLGVYARIVGDARSAVQATFALPDHNAHYALFLAFLRLLDNARAEANTITAKHLDFYYRQVLQLKEHPAIPSRAHVLVDLAKHAQSVLLAEGTLLKAGKDDKGADAHFAVDRDFVANKAAVTDLSSVYRHPHSPADGLAADADRIFASPIANSDDGRGAKLTTPDLTWQPFANKVYVDGELTEIHMPTAEIGFAIASHYLWLAEGKRTITIDLLSGKAVGKSKPLAVDLVAELTTEKGWLQKPPTSVTVAQNQLTLTIELDGNDPPLTPYVPKVHGYPFDTSLPMLVVKLQHRPGVGVGKFTVLEQHRVRAITLGVSVKGLKTLALSNDLGPIDSSKPFQPYGPAPIEGSALVIGSKEAFQKKPSTVTVNTKWMSTPVAHLKAVGDAPPQVGAGYLDTGTWSTLKGFTPQRITDETYTMSLTPAHLHGVDTPDLTASEQFATTSRHGFVRLRLSKGFELQDYTVKLAAAIKAGTTPPNAPVVPTMAYLTIDYDAVQRIDLAKADSNASTSRGRFFHVAPFGHAELLAPGPLVPQFAHEGELYIGVAGLLPPQNLALLFQVVDGTANPLAVKPDDHIEWSYLRGTEWVSFADDAVADGTDGLLASGIVTFAVPSDASTDSTLLPAGKHWIRVAVRTATDAVCRLVNVAAQALRATYVIDDPGSASSTQTLPAGTIAKLDTPDGGIKGINQPYPTFGGRPVENTLQFVTRVSERLRHKDRAIDLWDHEHLILDAFPDIYQARCLNHTQYDPGPTGGIYRERAAGHITVVTIPDLAIPNRRDPLRPYTSLRVLGEIERFLAERVSCFATLHVRNPRFEEVQVSLRVRFHEGVDETYHVNRLKREITEFLSPWAFRSGARPSFNGSIHRSALVDFVEDRQYVDYVTDVKLFHEGTLVSEEVTGSRAVSILVSVPAARHIVLPIHPTSDATQEHCACAPGSI